MDSSSVGSDEASWSGSTLFSKADMKQEGSRALDCSHEELMYWPVA